MTKRVNYDELEASDDSQLMLHNDEPFTGIAYEENANGQVIVERSFKDGIKDGPVRRYFPSGRLEHEGNWRYGGGHGFFRTWYENGQLEKEQYIEYGILVSERTWNQSGVLLAEFQLKESDSQYKTLESRRERFSNSSST